MRTPDSDNGCDNTESVPYFGNYFPIDIIPLHYVQFAGAVDLCTQRFLSNDARLPKVEGVSTRSSAASATPRLVDCDASSSIAANEHPEA